MSRIGLACPGNVPQILVQSGERQASGVRQATIDRGLRVDKDRRQLPRRIEGKNFSGGVQAKQDVRIASPFDVGRTRSQIGKLDTQATYVGDEGCSRTEGLNLIETAVIIDSEQLAVLECDAGDRSVHAIHVDQEGWVGSRGARFLESHGGPQRRGDNFGSIE